MKVDVVFVMFFMVCIFLCPLKNHIDLIHRSTPGRLQEECLQEECLNTLSFIINLRTFVDVIVFNIADIFTALFVSVCVYYKYISLRTWKIISTCSTCTMFLYWIISIVSIKQSRQRVYIPVCTLSSCIQYIFCLVFCSVKSSNNHIPPLCSKQYIPIHLLHNTM